MIVSFDKRWVICCPTKTGTTSLTSLLTERVASLAWQRLPKHTPYFHEEAASRIITCRHPLDRFCSMYYHLLREKGCGQKYALDGLDTFAEKFLEMAIEPDWIDWSIWTWTVRRMAEVFKATHFFDVTVDDGGLLLDFLRYEHSAVIPKTMGHLRRSKARSDWRSTIDQLRSDLRDRIIEWAAPDMELPVANVVKYEAY